MRRLFVLAFCFAFVPISLSAQSVQIQDVGLHGYYVTQKPTRVRIQATNPRPTPVSIELRLKVHVERKEPEPEGRVDTFSRSITLQPGEQRTLDLPVLIALSGRAVPDVLDLEASTASGPLTSERRSIGGALGDKLVVIVCLADDVCRKAEELLSLSGTTDERTGKLRTYTFLPVREPPSEWWAYSAAHSVVLAASPASLTPEQHYALEGYLRQGGQLFLIESFAGKTPFLSPYRQGKPSGQAQSVGMGHLYRFAGLDDQLATFFSRSVAQWAVDTSVQAFREVTLTRGSPEAMSWARKRLAINFVFPGFSWLLWWLLAYILVVGLLNFTILRRLDRREWGWITTPLIAIIFAVGFYSSSSAKRPKSAELDEIAVYALDEASPMAACRIGLRVSSPTRKNLSVSVPGDSVWEGPAENFSGLFVDGGFSLRGASPEINQGWHVGLGPPQHFELPLLQWSFRDLDFQGLREFPGSVRRLGPSKLLNQTGQSFHKALYLDRDKVYLLGPVAAGATVDLGSARQQSYDEAGISQKPSAIFQGELQQLASRPFSLLELVSGGLPEVTAGGAVFYGLSDEPVLGADLPGQQFVSKDYAITIVSFGSAP